ncbi:MAG: hypothetical protein ACQER6_07460 [Pseudomonadota bacterium]
MSEHQYTSLLRRGSFIGMLSSLLFAGGVTPISYAQTPPAKPEAPINQLDGSLVDGQISAVGASFIQLGSSMYDLTETVTVFDRKGQRIRVNQLQKNMDVRCRVRTLPDGSEVISEIRVMVR